jgi:hypothetical protein
MAGRWRWALLIQLAVMPAALARHPAASPDARASFVEPTDAAHRNCSGSCLETGALQWFCRPEQTCSLDCGTAPPRCTATTRIGDQTALPTKLPMPAVTAMASAPQKVTRAVARTRGAPPAFAPSAPSTARNTSEAADTV